MLTSKQRSELRAQANALEVTLMVGKGGVSESVISEAEILLESHELVKGRVLETAMMTAREVSDAICEETGAEGVSCVGYTFVIWRKSKKLEAAQKAKEKAATAQKKKVNPVKAGRQKRRAAAKAEKERKAQYFHDEAVKAAIERRKQYYQE
ncbi:MAG: YhbY family RNA-binding protein [Oscillospiraceae bacterium]|nr:YhbY family RNA-binding protein [Oscillospiraceae bacterium]